MSKIRFVLCLSVLFVLSGNVAGAVDLTGTWDWYGVEMSITQTGQQVNAFINISQPDIGNKAGDQMFCGTLNGQTLTGKIKVHGTPEYKTLCPATYFNFTDVTITVSADGNTLQGQLKNVFMNNDCTITPSENWVSMGTLTKKNNTPVYSGSGGTSACSGSSSGTTSTYTIIFQAGNGGTISGSSSQTVKQGSSASAVTAVPNTGYQFVNWTGTNGFATSTATPLTISNVSANMTISANFQQITPTTTPSNQCIQVGDNLTIPIACAEYKSAKYKFNLDYASDIYWKMNLNTFGNSDGGNICLSVVDDLKFNIDCVEYKGKCYSFAMNYSPEHGDSKNFYWKIDLNTFAEGCRFAIASKLDRTPGITGTDQNQNGIRDDIEKIIQTYPLNEEQKRSVSQFALTLQKAILSTSSKNEAYNNAMEIARAIECMASKTAAYRTYSKQLQAYTLNTEERVRAYIKFESLIGGSVFPEVEGQICK